MNAMNFINEHNDSLNILQQFIDNGGIIFGQSVLNILIENKFDVVKIYLPSDEIIENLELIFDQYEIKQITTNKKLWKINHLWILTTIKMPNIKSDELSNICITNNGISTFHYKNKLKSLEILEILRKINNKEIFEDPYVNISARWITYFLNNGHNVYGSWPSRYITAMYPSEMYRDIDINTSNYKSLRDMMDVLIDTNICFLTNKNTKKYTDKSLNVEMPTKVGILNFDIHKESKNMSCDAFHNNLKLTQTHLTINYQPENINFLNTLVLIFRDLFFNNYTLIKPFPIRVDNVGEFRLIIKPMIFSITHTLNYDYLENNKKENEVINELKDIITNNLCYKKCNHISNNNFEIPSTTVIKLGKKNKCLQCIHNHVVIQKELNDKRKIKAYYELVHYGIKG